MTTNLTQRTVAADVALDLVARHMARPMAIDQKSFMQGMRFTCGVLLTPVFVGRRDIRSRR